MGLRPRHGRGVAGTSGSGPWCWRVGRVAAEASWDLTSVKRARRPGEPDPVSEQGLMAELEAGSLGAARWRRSWRGPEALAAASLGDRGPLPQSTVSDDGALAPLLCERALLGGSSGSSLGGDTADAEPWGRSGEGGAEGRRRRPGRL